MVNYYYLAPFVAVVFFLLLGFFICFYYYKPCKRKEEDEVVNKQRRQQLNAAADCDFVEKKRSNSAVKDYFIVVHLWCMCTLTLIRSAKFKVICGSLAIIVVPGRNIIDIINRYANITTICLIHIPRRVDGASLEKTISKGSPKRIYRSPQLMPRDTRLMSCELSVVTFTTKLNQESTIISYAHKPARSQTDHIITSLITHFGFDT